LPPYDLLKLIGPVCIAECGYEQVLDICLDTQRGKAFMTPRPLAVR
jgi:hypothetical protein